MSSLVHLYSTEYMGGDPHLPRFMSYLSLFTFFMLILVTADNFLQMFVAVFNLLIESSQVKHHDKILG